MRVLVGCEESGKVRDAFVSRGHDAWSCDLVESRRPGNHLQKDVVEAIIEDGPWDIIILHPDCTCLTVAGNGTYGAGKDKHFLRLAAIEWTVGVWNLAKKYARIGAAFEQPVSVLPKKRVGKPQYIHPWQFGHPEQKKTCIYTHNLPPLEETDNVFEYMMTLPRKERERVFYMSPGPNRARDRSETFDGWADAMADQWGGMKKGACAKQVTRCTVIAKNGKRYVGENWCENPQQVCPREAGEGYEKCTTICRQYGHAEQVAVGLAGEEAKGAEAYLEGHTYACMDCQHALFGAGVSTLSISPPPDFYADDMGL